MGKQKKTPWLGEKILKCCLQNEDRMHRLGDFEEVFTHILSSDGYPKAFLWYWQQVMQLLPEFLLARFFSRGNMYLNYFKSALRNLKKYKVYSFINITGLAVGISCCLMIFIWVQDELSYNHFHENAKSIYRIITHEQKGEVFKSSPLSPPPLAEYLKNVFPEIKNATRFRIHNNWLSKVGEKKFMEDGIAFVEPSFFEIFTFPLEKGEPQTVLKNPYSVIITQSIAKKYFGNEDPVGKTIQFNQNMDFCITGVLKDIPENTHLSFQFAIPFSLLSELFNWDESYWYNVMYRTYVQVQEDVSVEGLKSKIEDVLKKQSGNDSYSLDLQPLLDIHLHSTHLQYKALSGGDIKVVRLFSYLAIVILVMACINFINLSTVKSRKRAKEVGMRKVSGAIKIDIIKQFLGETVFYTFLSALFALSITSILLSIFNEISGKHFTLIMIFNPTTLILILGIVVVAGLFSGSYPALILSSMQPVRIIKGNPDKKGSDSRFRRILVVIQFSVSTLLIFSTLVIYKQIDYIRTRKLGYDKECIIYLPVRGEVRQNYEMVKNALLENAAITDVTVCSSLPTQPQNYTSGLNWPGKDPTSRPAMWHYAVDADFIKTFNMEMSEGRDFSHEIPSDTTNFILNETALKYTGLSNPVGQWFSRSDKKGTIIGIVKDFHFESLKKQVEPLIIHLADFYQYLFIKVQPAQMVKTINHIRNTWQKVNPDYAFEYHFLDEAFDSLYQSESRLGNLFKIFTGLGIFISSLGLFGMASFMAQKRTKEIGIRKVLGASQSSLFILLSKEFIIMLIISNIIAGPLAFFSMSRWLQNWAYHTQIPFSLFIVMGLISFLIVLISIGLQALRVSIANPVESLKYE